MTLLHVAAEEARRKRTGTISGTAGIASEKKAQFLRRLSVRFDDLTSPALGLRALLSTLE